MQPLAHPPAPARQDEFAAVYRAHHDFVWRTLRHLGVDPGRVDDAVQDTFLVVHRRLAEFEGRSTLRTWLFEIARRVAARHRRVAAREAPRRCELPELPVAPRIEEDLARAEAAEILREFLAGLDPDKSVVFIMAELEQLRAPEIADALAVNLNTVYARLRAARQQLDRLIHRIQAREQRPRIRRAAEVVAAALLVQLPATAKAWSPATAALATRGSGGAMTLAPGLTSGPAAIVAGLAFAGPPARPTGRRGRRSGPTRGARARDAGPVPRDSSREHRSARRLAPRAGPRGARSRASRRHAGAGARADRAGPRGPARGRSAAGAAPARAPSSALPRQPVRRGGRRHPHRGAVSARRRRARASRAGGVRPALAVVEPVAAGRVAVR